MVRAKRARKLSVEADNLFATHEAKLQVADETPPTTDAADEIPHTSEAAHDEQPQKLERWMIPSLIERYKAAILDTDEDERPNQRRACRNGSRTASAMRWPMTMSCLIGTRRGGAVVACVR